MWNFKSCRNVILTYISIHSNSQEMGNKAVGGTPMIVKFVPVHFVIQQCVREL